jgi:hypothetical protein
VGKGQVVPAALMDGYVGVAQGGCTRRQRAHKPQRMAKGCPLNGEGQARRGPQPTHTTPCLALRPSLSRGEPQAHLAYRVPHVCQAGRQVDLWEWVCGNLRGLRRWGGGGSTMARQKHPGEAPESNAHNPLHTPSARPDQTEPRLWSTWSMVRPTCAWQAARSSRRPGPASAASRTANGQQVLAEGAHSMPASVRAQACCRRSSAYLSGKGALVTGPVGSQSAGLHPVSLGDGITTFYMYGITIDGITHASFYAAYLHAPPPDCLSN